MYAQLMAVYKHYDLQQWNYFSTEREFEVLNLVIYYDWRTDTVWIYDNLFPHENFFV
jgi:hypothetical protein